MEVPAKEEQTRLKICLSKMKTRARSVPYLVIFQFSIQNYLTYLILSAEITWFIWIFTLKMIQEVNYRTAIGLAKRFSVACMMYIHNWKHDGFSLFGISLVLKRLEQKSSPSIEMYVAYHDFRPSQIKFISKEFSLRIKCRLWIFGA